VTCQEQNADTWCSTLHIVMSHEIVMLLLTAERNSNLTMSIFFIIYSKKSVKPHSVVLKTVYKNSIFNKIKRVCSFFLQLLFAEY
jgi:hypothetical protein